jgi:predicted RNA binding protein YcfA (HicA-like mRNA interferase family)
MSGRDVISAFESLGFKVWSQRGSHVKLRRVTAEGEHQTLTVPSHTEVDTGTLRAIVRQASRYVTQEELREHFYV